MNSSSIFNSESTKQGAFAWKFLLLALPFVAWLGFPVLVLWSSGELAISVDAAVARQKNSAEPVFFGPAYSNPVKVFKLRSAQQRGAAILALGTSIVMEFRADFFREPESFYNAGGGISLLRELQTFLKRIPAERSPKLILLGLDQCQFNREWQPGLFQSWVSPYDGYRDPNPLQVIQDNWYAVYKAYYDRKFTLTCLTARRSAGAIGLRAMAEGGGFRNDGSQSFGLVKHLGAAHPACWDYRFRHSLHRVRYNEDRFEYGQEVSTERVAMLVPFLDECRRRHIHVIAFIPPIAPSVWREMTALRPKYRYIGQIVPVIGPLFTERGFTLHDFSDVVPLGGTDPEFLDGYHAGEKINLRMLIAMAESDPVLARLVDRDLLQHLLRTAKGPCSVFED